MDYEGELAIVIKQRMKEVPEQEALDYVLGYSCFNDVTERALVGRDTFNLTISKSFDTFGAFGPYIEPDIDPSRVGLKTYLNGKVMQEGCIDELVFDIPYLIEYCSTFATLKPGDVIATGTPGGVGAARRPPVWLRKGDIVEVEISGVGSLLNAVSDESR